jgi:uncharacterized membrane protein YphA (DoxX/SURF4 family)
MRIVTLIARILLGLMFLVFGLNGFLHFIPAPPPPGLAGQFVTVLVTSHYYYGVALVEVVGGALVLSGQFVPLGLTLLGPVLVNILLFHISMAPAGLPLALVATLLWFVVFYAVRNAFAGIFLQRA